MKKGLTELVFILDRSGSMNGLESDTIGGFNSLIEKQKKEEGEAHVTTVLFDDKIEIIHNRFTLNQIKPLTQKEYYVRGCTALLDAIGSTISNMGNTQKYLPDEERAEKVIFVIITDGLENSSKEYSYDRIKQMIEQKKNKYQWEFLFLGANMDAVAEAKRSGIHEDRAVRYHNDKQGVQTNYRVVGEALCFMRHSQAPISKEWKKEIEEDFKVREDFRR